MDEASPHPARSPRPVIGITMGEPFGIGPEIVVKALADRAIQRAARFVVYGMNELLTYAADRAEINPFWYRVPHDSERAAQTLREGVVVLDYDEFDGVQRVTSGATRAGGIASKTFVEDAIADAMLPLGAPRHLDAIVTAPICKESWQLAGFKWPGHTELLGKRTNAKRQVMMFISPRLRVALATAHIGLMELRNVLTIGRVFDTIELAHDACRQLGLVDPKIAVCGLNPHAGEHGQFGDEEDRLIKPAIEVARQNGIDARGPFPADTIFIDALSGRYDLVVAMYHDQGLIPVKLLDRDEAVNVTMGLPIIRTSPDHGTAFDIAGQNRANPGSMKAAIQLAAQMASKQFELRGNQSRTA